MTLEISDPHEGVLLLTIDRPEARNALSREVRRQLSDAVAGADRDDAVRVVVVTGRGGNFAAGADVKAFAGMGTADHMREGLHPYWEAVKRLSKPMIAAVEGYALGGGCELAMHADIIVAARDAKFGQPEIRLGIMPGAGGTQRLVRALGKFKAMHLLLTGAMLSGEEAEKAGLVSKAVEPGTALEEALALARIVAGMPPIAARAIKEVVLSGEDLPLDAALLLERKAFQALFDTADGKEGIAAFIEKRKPDFKGR